MKKIIFPAMIIAIVNMANTCRKKRSDCHVYYTIKNHSSSAIYFKWSRDTTLNLISYSPAVSSATYKCQANSQNNGTHLGCFEAEINFSLSKKLNIWIFDAHLLETVPWDTVKKNYMILKRYSLTKAQLDSADWIINYL